MSVLKISHIKANNPNFIIVRHYDNRIVNVPSEQRILEDIAIGCWRLKKEVLIIPKEYKHLNEIQWQEIK